MTQSEHAWLGIFAAQNEPLDPILLPGNFCFYSRTIQSVLLETTDMVFRKVIVATALVLIASPTYAETVRYLCQAWYAKFLIDVDYSNSRILESIVGTDVRQSFNASINKYEITWGRSYIFEGKPTQYSARLDRMDGVLHRCDIEANGKVDCYGDMNCQRENEVEPKIR